MSSASAAKAPLPGRLCRIALAAALAAAAIPAATLSAEQAYAAGLPTRLVNGDFSYPAKPNIPGYKNEARNDLYISPDDGTSWFTMAVMGSAHTSWTTIGNWDKSKFGWTSDEPYIDHRGDGAAVAYKANTVQVNFDDTTQDPFGELSVTTEDVAIHQDISTTVGGLYKWSLKHSSYDSTYDDSMRVMIGPIGATAAQSARRTTVNGNGDRAGSVGTLIKTHNAPNSTKENQSYGASWETYAGEYIATSTVTRFTYKAVDSKMPGMGNNLDDVTFAKYDPLVYDLNGGSASGLDTTLAQARADNYSGYFREGATKALSSVKPARTGYTFLGWSKTRIADRTTKAAYDGIKGSLVSSVRITAGTNTVHAVWGKDPTVTFRDGEPAPSTLKAQTVAFGGGASAPAAPARTGYTFTGWDRAYDAVYEDVTVNAKWRANAYAIAFDANGGEGSMEDQAMTYDEAEDLSANAFTREGYTWQRWSTAANGGGSNYADEQSVVNLTAADGGTVRLYSVWAKNPTITFEDGWGDVLKTEVVASGGTPTPPDDPEHTGYIFTGWSPIPEKATEDATCFAQWEPVRYTVEYAANGGTGETPSSTVGYDDAYRIERCGFERIGYAFKGWSAGADGTGRAFAELDEVRALSAEDGAVIALYAQWEPHRYAISFDANGGEGSMEDLPMAYGTPAELPPCAFTHPGFSFKGWALDRGGAVAYEDGAAIRDRTSEPDGAVTLYAVWEEDPDIHIQYAPLEAGTCEVTSAGETIAPKTGEPIGSTCAPAAGYKFVRWVTATGDTACTTAGIRPERGSDGVLRPASYYAVVAPIGYAIRYDANGGAGEMHLTSCTYGEGATIAQCGFSRPGFLFTGWSPERGGGASHQPGERVRNLADREGAVVTLYAQWAAEAYTVSFDANGGTGQMEPVHARHGEEVEVPESAFERTGYAFKGWNAAADGSGTGHVPGDRPVNLSAGSAEAVLYAQWEACPYTIRYDANGGAGSMPAQGARYDEDVELAHSRFYREGCAFIGWSTASDGTGTRFSEGQTVRNLADAHGAVVTLYAQWAPKAHHIIFEDGWGNVIGEADVEHGGTAEPPAVAGPDGFEHAGWDASLEGITEDMTVHATWRDVRRHVGWSGEVRPPQGAATAGAAYDKTGDAGMLPAGLIGLLAATGASSLALGMRRARREDA